MVFLTCSVSFRSISCRYFSKWRLKIFSGGNHPPPPVPWDFYSLPYPRVRGTPGFFSIKITAKDCLDARGHFVLRFGATGHKPLGVTTPLRKTMVNTYRSPFYSLNTRFISMYWIKGTPSVNSRLGTVRVNHPTLAKLYAILQVTVVWNDYLLIFSQKCHILFHKKVGNSLQIIKYINLSRFQHILKLLSQFCWKFIHLKAV